MGISLKVEGAELVLLSPPASLSRVSRKLETGRKGKGKGQGVMNLSVLSHNPPSKAGLPASPGQASGAPRESLTELRVSARRCVCGGGGVW